MTNACAGGTASNPILAGRSNLATVEQLSLLTSPAPTPDSPIRFKPCPNVKGATRAIDSYSERDFGSPLYGIEVELVANYFKDWVGPIPPKTFGMVAEWAIRERQGFCFIPADKSDRCCDLEVRS